jgi:hypothetical protein
MMSPITLSFVSALAAMSPSRCTRRGPSATPWTNFHARNVQTQELLTKRIAVHLQRQLSPYGVGVVIDAEHTCMSPSGARAEFLSLARPSRGAR